MATAEGALRAEIYRLKDQVAALKQENKSLQERHDSLYWNSLAENNRLREKNRELLDDIKELELRLKEAEIAINTERARSLAPGTAAYEARRKAEAADASAMDASSTASQQQPTGPHADLDPDAAAAALQHALRRAKTKQQARAIVKHFADTVHKNHRLRHAAAAAARK
jgi:hypothetical protein